jgi:hypothetical protein
MDKPGRRIPFVKILLPIIVVIISAIVGPIIVEEYRASRDEQKKPLPTAQQPPSSVTPAPEQQRRPQPRPSNSQSEPRQFLPSQIKHKRTVRLSRRVAPLLNQSRRRRAPIRSESSFRSGLQRLVCLA